MPVVKYEPLTLDEIERRHILATLKAEGWNKSRTASVLGLSVRRWTARSAGMI